MAVKDAYPFSGLGTGLPEYLLQLEHNNTRPWYHENKEAFKKNVREPIQALVKALEPAMVKIDTDLKAKISRVQRDIRFSANKAPYHTNIWFIFCHTLDIRTDAPAFYFEAKPDSCQWGTGFYQAKAKTMALFREIAAQNQKTFSSILNKLKKRGFTIHGETYKKPLKMPETTHKDIAFLYGIRNIYLTRTHTYDDPSILAPALLKTLADDFLALSPFYDLLRMAHLQSQILAEQKSAEAFS